MRRSRSGGAAGFGDLSAAGAASDGHRGYLGRGIAGGFGGKGGSGVAIISYDIINEDD